jgi:uncharacterized protein YmfQ (DUF2313 family)
MRNLTEIQRDMRDYLPRYYGDMPIATNIIDREAEEFAKLNADIYDVLAQMYIETATWGLAQWEHIFGLVTDTTKTYAQRREVLMSRLRGVGAVSAELIESVASAYANGDTAVTANVPAYTITVTFGSTYGVPEQMAELQSAVRDITPAHLAINYVFRYYMYSELKASGLTYGELTALGLTYDELKNRGIA